MDWIKCITSRLLRQAARQAGVTLIETVFAISIFGLVSTSIIGVITSATAADGNSRQKTIALQLAQQQVEYVRQLGYRGICIKYGNPPCPASTVGISPSQSKWVMGLRYNLSTSVKWVDDPVSGGFSTHANYKRIRVVVSRATDGKVLSTITTYVSSTTREALGGINNAVVNVRAVDYGKTDKPPLGGVTIHMTNTTTGYNASDTTDSTEGSAGFGQVTFAAVAPTTQTTEYYDVTADLLNWETLKEDLPASAGATTHFQLAPSDTQTRTVNLYRPCSIYVHVKDEATGEDYMGHATVKISSPRGTETFTTETGYVPVTDTLAGEKVVPGSGYSVTVDTPDYRHGELTNLTVPENYASGLLSSTFNVTLATIPVPQNATLTVTVRRIRYPDTDCEDGTALWGASVTISDPGQSPPYSQSHDTNLSGVWAFADIPLGTYDISARYRSGGRWRTGGLSDVPVTTDTGVCVPILY